MCLLGFSGKEGKRYFTAQILKGSGVRSAYCVFCSRTCLLISNNIVKTKKRLKLCCILERSFVPRLAVCVQSNAACSKRFLVRQSCTIRLNHNMSLVWVLSWCVPRLRNMRNFFIIFHQTIPWKIKFTWWNCRGRVIRYSRDRCTRSARRDRSLCPGIEMLHWLLCD